MPQPPLLSAKRSISVCAQRRFHQIKTLLFGTGLILCQDHQDGAELSVRAPKNTQTARISSSFLPRPRQPRRVSPHSPE